MNVKVQSLEGLSGILKRCGSRAIVQCHGVFDVLHAGHVSHLEEAKAMGDILVVTITSDQFVNKGDGRPENGQGARAQALAALGCVDYVAITDAPTAANAICNLRPNIYAKGPDYQEPLLEQMVVEDHGGKVAFTNGTKHSSTALIEAEKYLDGAKDLKVLVVGEAIQDEYVYCDVLGKAGKEPVIVGQQVRTEKYWGGTDAIANQLDKFCQVSLLAGSLSVIKRRFVDVASGQKLFELYEMGTSPAMNWIAPVIEAADVVIVADYGHGLLDACAIDHLVTHAKFLVVNCQLNAGNRGFHTISKYRGANLICVSEGELRLDARDQHGDLRQIIAEASIRLDCPQIIVTRGKQGCLAYDGAFTEIPAQTTEVIDRIGAGDAVFAIAAICAAQGAPVATSALIGNAAGAVAVGIVANSVPVSKEAIMKQLGAL